MLQPTRPDLPPVAAARRRLIRWLGRGLAMVAALLLATALPVPALGEGAAGAEAGPATVLDTRFGVNGGESRFVLDLTDAVPFRVHTAADPWRVIVDLPPVVWLPPVEAGPGQGLYASFQYGHFDAATHRLVLVTAAPAHVKRAFFLPADDGGAVRFVLDAEAISQEAFAAQSNRFTAGTLAPAPPPPTSEITAPDLAALAAPAPSAPRRPVVVIDPGHGGVDPGAVAVNGVYEKRLTLAVGLLLAQHLEASGRYQVVMTRRTDIFVPLRERVRIARAAGADLFVSLHADSVERGTVRGSSVYTLSETASDAEAAALAQSENRADIIAGFDFTEEQTDVAGILIDLAQRETLNQSRSFAGTVVQALGDFGLNLVRRPHRSAGFVVLKAADVPSVLVELGYLSDEGEARLLATPEHQQRLSVALAAAVDRHFGHAEIAGRP